LDISVYHCQQAAEKAIKAWLVSQEIPFAKTHDLERLLDCAGSDSLAHLGNHMRILTPYVVEFRYPGDVFEPEESEVVEAIRLATEVLDCISKLLS
jgi:HEPN domain-containing protein